MCVERGYLLTSPLAQERINASSDAKHSNVLKIQQGFWLLVDKFPLRISVWNSLKFPCLLTHFRLPPGFRWVFALLRSTEGRTLVFCWTIRSCLDIGHDRFLLILSNYFAKGCTTTWLQRILHSAVAVAECPVLHFNGFNTVNESRRWSRPQNRSVGLIVDTKPRLCQDSNCNRLALATLYPHNRLIYINIYTVIPRLTKIIRSGITFVSRNVISRRFL